MILKKWNLKKKKKKTFYLWICSQVRYQWSYSQVHVNNRTFNLYKERKYALRTFGTFLYWISSNFSASLRVHNIFYLVRWITLIYKSMLLNLPRYWFRDINPNQSQMDSRYRSHLLDIFIIIHLNRSPPSLPAIDFVL